MRRFLKKAGLRYEKVFGLVVCLILSTYSMSAMAAEKILFDLFPEGENINPVSLAFTGKVYTESWWFDEVSKGIYPAADDEKFIIKIVDTNLSGTPQDVLNLWAPAEREEMKSLIFDTNIFANNRAFAKKVQASAFMVKILYGNYTIFLVQDSGTTIGDLITTYTLKKVDNSYYQTNLLEADPVYIYITQKYSKSLKFKQRVQ